MNLLHNKHQDFLTMIVLCVLCVLLNDLVFQGADFLIEIVKGKNKFPSTQVTSCPKDDQGLSGRSISLYLSV